MRMSINSNIWISTVLYQNIHNPIYITVFSRASIKFTIAVSTCPSFTKTIIGIGINNLILLNGSYVTSSFLNIFSPLNNYRFNTKLNKF